MFVVNVLRDVTQTVLQQRHLEDQTRELEAQSELAQSLAEELEQSNEQLLRALEGEQEALRREAYLSKATDLLGESLEYEKTLQRVASLVVPELADWSAVDLVSETTAELRQLAVAHVDPDKVRWARQLHDKFPPNMDAPRGLPNVLRTGEPELYPHITDDMLVETARNAEELAILRTLALRSVMIVPLRAQQRIVGAITLVTAESGKSYTESDLVFATELGRRAGMAIERATLHQDVVKAYTITAEHARWLSRLHLLTVGLSRSITSAEVVELATTLGREAFDADRSTLWLLDTARTALHLVGQHALPPDIAAEMQPVRVDAPYPIAEAIRSGEPVFVEDDDTALAPWPEVADITRLSPTRAGAAMPIKVGGEIIGGLTYAYAQPHGFSPDYVMALRTFSKELGQALQRTRVVADLEEARTAADAASQAKSAFLATMSHELRTPINAIIGFTELLMMKIADGESAGESLYLERIRRNTEHLLALISDVLDWSKVEAGQLVVKTSQQPAADVAADALNVVSNQGTARGISVLSHVAEGATYVGDPLRVKQILLNLLSNGIKFTPQGGSVLLDCLVAGAETRFSVEDTGIGIAPSEVDSIFEPFVQSERGYTRGHGGTGLGLSISRRLARLMGGDVTLESSTPGRGSRFVLSLPARERRKTPRDVRRVGGSA
jgi:signal transduction histidine kinase